MKCYTVVCCSLATQIASDSREFISSNMFFETFYTWHILHIFRYRGVHVLIQNAKMCVMGFRTKYLLQCEV